MARNIEADFWKYVDKTTDPNGCWLWTASRINTGYGRFSVNKKTKGAHRYSWYLKTGEEPEVVMHKCDNPPCVNPDHLQAGTSQENRLDCFKKGRAVILKGEKSNFTKYTDITIDMVRAAYASGFFTQKEVGQIFGMSQIHVSRLARRVRRATKTEYGRQ